MASDDAPANLTASGPQPRKYGSTSLVGHASAHLGDTYTSQGVVINGNVNIHHSPALDVIELSNRVIQFLDVITELQRFCENLQRLKPATDNELTNLEFVPSEEPAHSIFQRSSHDTFEEFDNDIITSYHELQDTGAGLNRDRSYPYVYKPSPRQLDRLRKQLITHKAVVENIVKKLKHCVGDLARSADSTNFAHTVNVNQTLHESSAAAFTDARRILSLLEEVRETSHAEAKLAGTENIRKRVRHARIVLAYVKELEASELTIHNAKVKPEHEKIRRKRSSRAKALQRFLDHPGSVESDVRDEAKDHLSCKYLLDKILHHWENGSLSLHHVNYETCRERLNIHLADVLKACRSLRQSQEYYQDDVGEDLEQLSPDNDIVEVLSISKARTLDSEVNAAVLTLGNGQNVTLLSSAVPDKRHKSVKDATAIHRTKNIEDAASTDHKRQLIKYDLSGNGVGDHATNDVSPALVNDAVDHIRLILGSLHFREESARRVEVRDAHRKTFKWILEPPNTSTGNQGQHCFRDWLRGTGHCFWISGKAGSGKSTLMKYIYDHDALKRSLNQWAGSKQVLVCSFFLWYAGTQLQKSYEGVLRSLLYQILVERPDLVPTAFPRLTRYLLLRKTSEELVITVEELTEAFQLLSRNLPNNLALFLLIDGVDEYNEDQFDFTRFLVDVSRRPWVKLLASSRPIPICHQIFSKVPHLRLQDLTAGDIMAYVHEELVCDQYFQEMDSYEDGFGQQVIKALTEKASGVFLWIVLVVRRLLIGLSRSEDSCTLMKSIDELPNDLENLYDFMFGRMTETDQREGARYLQILAHTRQAQTSFLSAIQLYIMDRYYRGEIPADSQIIYDKDQEQRCINMIDRKLRSCCCGLIEVQYTFASRALEEPRVDYLHRTVYDYLREPFVWNRILSLFTYAADQMEPYLLASCTYRLRQIKSGQTPYSTEQHILELFTDCLTFGIGIATSTNLDYAQHLAFADDVYHYCSDHDPSAYSKVFKIMVNKLDMPDDLNRIAPRLNHDHISSLVFAELGLSAFFEQRVSVRHTSRGEKETLLIDLLATVHRSRSDSMFMPSYLRSIQFLFSIGADPGTAANCEAASGASVPLHPNLSAEEHRKFYNAPPSGAPLTPWEYWLHLPPSLNSIELGLTLDMVRVTIDAGSGMSTNVLIPLEELAASIESGAADGSLSQDLVVLGKNMRCLLSEASEYHEMLAGTKSHTKLKTSRRPDNNIHLREIHEDENEDEKSGNESFEDRSRLEPLLAHARPIYDESTPWWKMPRYRSWWPSSVREAQSRTNDDTLYLQPLNVGTPRQALSHVTTSKVGKPYSEPPPD